MNYKLKVFLAALAVAFATQVTLRLNDYYDDVVVTTALRLLIGALAAAAFTFFWGEFKNRQQKEKH